MFAINPRQLVPFLLGPLFGLALLAGCATGPSISTSSDSQVNYQNYHTFAVVRNRTPSNPEVTPELIRGVNDATAAAFRNKGLTEVPENQADVLVLPHGMIENKIDITDWGFNYGRFHRWGYGAAGGPYQLDQYREGTLLIDVVDAHSKELIWRGTAQSEVVGPPDLNRVRPIIDQIVARYPMTSNGGHPME